MNYSRSFRITQSPFRDIKAQTIKFRSIPRSEDAGSEGIKIYIFICFWGGGRYKQWIGWGTEEKGLD